jgi:integrase
MYVEKRGATYRYEFKFRGKKRRRGGFPTKRLAELAGDAHLRQLLEKRVERIWGIRERSHFDAPTLAEYVESGYKAHHFPRLAKSTQKTASSQLRRLISGLGAYSLDDLLPQALDVYVTQRLAEGVSPQHVAGEINRLARVVNHARSRGVLFEHPFPRYKRPRGEETEIQVIEDAEEDLLLKAAPRVFRDWIPIALDTGLRKGELRLLESGRVTVTRKELHIRQSKVHGRLKAIPLTSRVRRILERLRRTGGRYLLGKPGGETSWSLPWIDRRWSETRRAANLPDIRFNALRHTFATRLHAAGVDLAVVGELMGHKKPYMTTLRYIHALEDAKRAAIARLGARRQVQRAPKRPPRRTE